MKTTGIASAAIATTGFLASTAVAQASGGLPALEIKGSKFFYSNNGSQFYMRGVAYQQDISSNGTLSGTGNFTDPLASPDNCKRDIPLLQGLYANAIRVYALDPKKDHTECMQMLTDAGIYVIADLSSPVESINRDTPTWNDDLYTRYTSVVDAMANYTNIIGFFAGNEVSNNASNTGASAFVKAAVRDTKAYIKQKKYRPIGVGYATNDDADIRENLASYFDCGDPAQAIDFWGYNIYSWCGDSSIQESGYGDRTKEFSSYNVPAFFAEFGCNQVEPRTFSEVGALFGPQMNNVWSGGIVYMYFQEANNYGLVTVSENEASKLPDYGHLQSAYSSVVGVTGVNSASYSPTNKPAACPTANSAWAASSDLPPTPNQELCNCMEDALTCVPANSVSDTDIGDFFGVLCGLSDTACAGIAANGTTGKYGAYAMCNARQQLGWALNAYYAEQTRAGNGPSACDFSGSATTQAAVAPTGNCKALISQAGSEGTGTVTSAPSATGGSSGSGSSGGSSGSSSSGNAAGVHVAPSLFVHIGALQIGLYLFAAVGSGFAMILL